MVELKVKWNTIHPFLLAIPFITFMVTSTNMTWIPPSFPPQTYHGYHQCHRLCEKTFGPIIPLTCLSHHHIHYLVSILVFTVLLVLMKVNQLDLVLILTLHSHLVVCITSSHLQLLCCFHNIYSTYFICQ